MQDRVREGVDARLTRVLDERRRLWESLSPASDELLDAAAALLSGGKRTRALLEALGACARASGASRP